MASRGSSTVAWPNGPAAASTPGRRAARANWASETLVGVERGRRHAGRVAGRRPGRTGADAASSRPSATTIVVGGESATTRPMTKVWSLRRRTAARAARHTALMRTRSRVRSRATRPSASSISRLAHRVARRSSWVTMQQRLADLVEVEQQVHHLLAGAAVQGAGRLVGQQQRRAVHQRPGDRDPLPLAAAERRRVGVAPVGDAEFVEQFQRPRAGLAGPGCR